MRNSGASLSSFPGPGLARDANAGPWMVQPRGFRGQGPGGVPWDMVLYSAADLVWASKIKATADAMGVPARPARTLEMLEARLGDSAVRMLLVDLDKGDEALQLIARLKGPAATERERAIRVVAFGPHVATGLLDAAQGAGADAVLTRGAMDKRLGEILGATA